MKFPKNLEFIKIFFLFKKLRINIFRTKQSNDKVYFKLNLIFDKSNQCFLKNPYNQKFSPLLLNLDKN